MESTIHCKHHHLVDKLLVQELPLVVSHKLIPLEMFTQAAYTFSFLVHTDNMLLTVQRTGELFGK